VTESHTLILNIIEIKALCIFSPHSVSIPAIAAGSAYIITKAVAIIISLLPCIWLYIAT